MFPNKHNQVVKLIHGFSMDLDVLGFHQNRNYQEQDEEIDEQTL
jgi:hypothetical protein